MLDPVGLSLEGLLERVGHGKQDGQKWTVQSVEQPLVNLQRRGSTLVNGRGKEEIDVERREHVAWVEEEDGLKIEQGARGLKEKGKCSCIVLWANTCLSRA